MNRIIVTLICIVVIVGAIFTAVILSSDSKQNEDKLVETQKIAEETILDECTDEYEQIENGNMIETNSNAEKISPNCEFIQKIYYSKCGHTISNYLNLPKEMVNLTQDELKEKYSDWKIENFESNQVVLYKEMDSECGEHYLLKDREGKIVIYKILNEDLQNLEEIEETDIYTEYLTDTDKLNIEKGIRVNGKQELNQLIEDFE